MMIRRPLEAGTHTLYVMWLLFLPLLIFAPTSFTVWADRRAGQPTRSSRPSISI